MKTNDEVRRLNLLIAIKRVRTASNLAAMIDTAPAYLSQIKNRTPDSKTGTPKTMGEDVARRIEVAINEQPGWMDTPHGDDEQQAAPARVIDQSGKLPESMRLTIETARELRLITVYRLANERDRLAIDNFIERMQAGLTEGSRNEGKPSSA